MIMVCVWLLEPTHKLQPNENNMLRLSLKEETGITQSNADINRGKR